TDFVTPEEGETLVTGAQAEGVQRKGGVRVEKRWHDLSLCSLREHRFGVSATPLPGFVEFMGRRCIERGLTRELPYRLIFADYALEQGMPAHTDSVNLPVQRDCHAVLSLLSTREMVFTEAATKRRESFMLTPLSLLVMRDEVRYNWTHEVLPGP